MAQRGWVARTPLPNRCLGTKFTNCDALTYGSYTDWRLPTQKELAKAYIDGIVSIKDTTSLNLSITGASVYLTATTASSNTAYARTVNLGWGTNDYALKTATTRHNCVRP